MILYIMIVRNRAVSGTSPRSSAGYCQTFPHSAGKESQHELTATAAGERLLGHCAAQARYNPGESCWTYTSWVQVRLLTAEIHNSEYGDVMIYGVSVIIHPRMWKVCPIAFSFCCRVMLVLFVTVYVATQILKAVFVTLKDKTFINFQWFMAWSVPQVFSACKPATWHWRGAYLTRMGLQAFKRFASDLALAKRRWYAWKCMEWGYDKMFHFEAYCIFDIEEYTKASSSGTHRNEIVLAAITEKRHLVECF